MPMAEWNREYPRRVTSDLVPDADDAAAAEVETGPVRRIGATYALGRFVVAPLARLVYRPHVEGRGNVPKSGPVIFASNHLSFIDSIAIPVAAPRPVHFLAKSSYFDGPGLGGWLSKQFFTAIGAVPVQRGAGQAALDALEQQRALLEQGSTVALYPEGTRSLDGRLYKGRTGVAFLALQTGAPVVPVGLIGTDDVMPVGAKMPSLTHRVTVKFGEPLDLGHHGPATSGRARRAATDEIMAAIHALSGQELANAYNEVPAQSPIERIKQVLPHERR
ncbi:1-acyl-sn-glycerol-3-phosphate acyltransferase [Microbacterium sp. CFH 90308]|uniref:1-acyl-sn-glycerol-3-phosphate acyltransferase n=1 Tax=Microbacterium salsuginis TaxID=2722803 RepID=A0ABX1K9T0_9MICO|nr:lysophospholipid acyltransferase family protein [Microbacterium sp. CFH 90308]NLP83757.1 1-acyl-sn-glycerol-3-phosphate acyltransferase [Microbacterium sp. CFH 90308]